jgi:hypothetical protein
MQQFDASMFFWIMRGLAKLGADERQAVIPEGERKHLLGSFKNYQPGFAAMGLSASRVTARKLADTLEKQGCRYCDINGMCKELQDRLVDETDDKVFFMMTVLESEFYKNPRRGWERSIDRFPKTVDDVVEASRCFALSRYPAAVFHSVQIVEAGLIELGTFLKIADPHSGWTAVSSALNKVIKTPHSDRTPFERKNFAFLEQVQGTVEGLKNAWRNKISHSGGRLVIMTKEFGPEVAEEIVFATRAFMRRLAEGLPPPKQKKGKLQPLT